MPFLASDYLIFVIGKVIGDIFFYRSLIEVGLQFD